MGTKVGSKMRFLKSRGMNWLFFKFRIFLMLASLGKI